MHVRLLLIYYTCRSPHIQVETKRMPHNRLPHFFTVTALPCRSQGPSREKNEVRVFTLCG